MFRVLVLLTAFLGIKQLSSEIDEEMPGSNASLGYWDLGEQLRVSEARVHFVFSSKYCRNIEVEISSRLKFENHTSTCTKLDIRQGRGENAR